MIRSRKRSLAPKMSFHMKLQTTTTNPDPDLHDERMESQRRTERTDKHTLPRAVPEKVLETTADFYSGEKKIADGHAGQGSTTTRFEMNWVREGLDGDEV
jgi:hypothetical protein